MTQFSALFKLQPGPRAQIDGGTVGDPAPQNKPHRILVLEDDPLLLITTLRIVFKDVKELVGDVRVIACTNGDDGLHAIQGPKDFDAIFSDWQMPGASGAAVYKHARWLGMPSEKIVLVTGNANPPMDAFEEGDHPVNLLKKPINKEEMIAAIAAAIRHA